jgi:hypothetical protein
MVNIFHFITKGYYAGVA